eukprot:TRINITY_DN10172_c0_g4_i1.p1 TRINITY_DN10172_c0_g4~~TRINITY_DN10172_c0_g4_i1.p1  ORF type:complete len:435 (+),score=78.20 TRINITY_DN10172_c0_g4_i1:112-1416(+)
MGLKKLLRKMPQQKRVPLKKKVSRPAHAQKATSIEPSLQFEEIYSLEELAAFLKEHACTLAGVLKRFMAQQTDNTAFEAKGMHQFISLCLSYALKLPSAELADGVSLEEVKGLTEVIQELDPGQKWGIIEWSKLNLARYIRNIDFFASVTREMTLEFTTFLFITKQLLSGSAELENPLILTAISIACHILQTMKIDSSDTAISHLSILWEVYLLCRENNQTLPEAISFLTKLLTFIESTDFSIEIPANECTLFSIMISTSVKLKNFYIAKYSLHLLYNLCLDYSSFGCYESISNTITRIGDSLSKRTAGLSAYWGKCQEVVKKSLKQEERTKESLQLQLEKPKEIKTFEPIIDDEYLPFNSRNKELMSTALEKRRQKKEKQSKRVEVRKIKKQALLQEEIRNEQRDHFMQKQTQLLKIDRRNQEQDYMYSAMSL